MPKYTYETRRVCPNEKCQREVDAVRTPELKGLVLSRHFKPGTFAFCPNSLDEAPR